MAEESKYVPDKEAKFSYGEKVLFGICCECKNPINYPAIKIPRNCTEIENHKEAGVSRFSIEYADYHVSCAVYNFLRRSAVSISPKVHLPEGSRFRFFNYLFTKVYGKLNISLEVDKFSKADLQE